MAGKPGFALRRLWLQKMAEWFGSTVFTTFEQATFLAKPAHQFQVPVPALALVPTPTPRRPRLLHAPSDPLVKRTDLVLRVVEHLKNEGLDFEFLHLSNQPNAAILAALRETDLVIDQPNLLFGVLAREAMAAGVAVAGIPDFTGQEHLSKAPVIPFPASEAEFTQILGELLRSPDRLDELKQASLAYHREHFAPEAVYRSFMEAVDGHRAPEVKPLPRQKELCARFATRTSLKWAIRLLMRHPRPG